MGLIEEKNLVFTSYTRKGTITKRCESTSGSYLAGYLTCYSYWDIGLLNEAIAGLQEGMEGLLNNTQKINIGLDIYNIWVTAEHVEVYEELRSNTLKGTISHKDFEELLQSWKAFLLTLPDDEIKGEKRFSLTRSKKRWKIYTIIGLGYFIIKFNKNYEGGRFTDKILIDNIIFPLIHFFPIGIFLFSIYLLTAHKRGVLKAYFAQGFLGVVASVAALILISLQYPIATCFCSEYFFELNTGEYIHKSEDFRLEFLIAVLCNVIALLYYIGKITQPYMRRKNEN